MKENRKRDVNVIKGEERVEELRQKLMKMVVDHLDESSNEDWCKCDVCTLVRMTANENKSYGLIDSMALVGFEYLLGENFNGAAALYYHSYVKETEAKYEPKT